MSAGSSAASGDLLAELAIPRPLSQSPLWLLHEDYFRRQGVAAWTSGDVPHLLTNSPMVARAYAQVVEGVLEDCGRGRFGAFEAGEPLYVLELGAGIGRLAYNILHALAPAEDGVPRLVYVLTDAFESNLEFWRTHPRLQPALEQGRLDLARFDVAGDTEVRLERSGRVLSPGSLANPLLVVANYVFDILRQDLYRVEGGVLVEELVSAELPDAGVEIGSREFFRQLLLHVDPVEVPPDRYSRSELDAVLAEIAAERAAWDNRFLFPAQPLRGLANLVDLSGGRLVLLLGERPGEAMQPDAERPTDQPAPAAPAAFPAPAPAPGTDGVPAGPAVTAGPAPAPRTDGAPPPLPPGTFRPGHLLAMGVHGGSISLPVDLDILSRITTRRGGVLLLPEASPAGLLIGACIVGDGGAARATRRRFALAVDEGGPEDLFLSLRAMLDRGTDDLPLSMALALLRVGGYDAHLFRQMHDRLAEVLPGADPAGVEEAARVMREVWERFFPIDDRTDLAFGIAALLAPAGRVTEALEFLGYSRDRAPTPLGSYNAALCHLLLGDEESARGAVDEALELDPALEAALELRRQMDAQSAGGA